MGYFDRLSEAFSAIGRRNQIFFTIVAGLILAFFAIEFFLWPQWRQITESKEKTAAHQRELAKLQSLLIRIKEETERGIDPYAKEKATIAEMESQIKATSAFLSETGPSVSQVGDLVRGLIKANPGLELASLRIRPSAVFYTPPPAPAPKAAVSAEMEKVLSRIKQEKEKSPEKYVLVKSTIYKHGIDVSVKGSYAALLSYLRQVESYSKPLYWSEVALDAKDFRQANLKLVIFTLSDQANPPLK